MLLFSQKKECKIYFASDFFIGYGKTYFNFQFIYLKITLCTILDEVAFFERTNEKFMIEVIIQRQENKGKFWFIISRPF